MQHNPCEVRIELQNERQEQLDNMKKYPHLEAGYGQAAHCLARILHRHFERCKVCERDAETIGPLRITPPEQPVRGVGK